MKFFTNKNLIQKMTIILVIIMLFNFIAPTNNVQALGIFTMGIGQADIDIGKENGAIEESIGGLLFDAVFDLVATIIDGIYNGVQSLMLGEYSIFMKELSDTQEYYEPVQGLPTTTINSDKIDSSLFGKAEYKIPVIRYSPEEIFANKIPELDINFLNPSVKTNGQVDQDRNSAYILRDTIASWYVAIRTLALVGLLSVLVYLGIRMVLSSATDKAKYKEMLMDWVIALCLLFSLHFIMSFALTACETITSMIAGNTGSSVNIKVTGDNATEFSTNLIGMTRFYMQSKDIWSKIEYFILYIMMIGYTFKFTWTYLKRVLNMAFLTLIAPFVALTYPIDKVSDGKAQAFNMWIREFAFNALLQPFHLLLYIVLVSSALDLAVRNPLYAVVALGFISAAEKLLKKMFGFDKANGGTISPLVSATGGALATKAFSALKSGGSSSSGGKDKIRTQDNANKRIRDVDGNKKLEGFEANAGNMSEEEIERLTAGDDVPLPSDNKNQSPKDEEPAQFDGQDEMDKLNEELNGKSSHDFAKDPELAEKERRYQELEEQRRKWQEGNTEYSEGTEKPREQPVDNTPPADVPQDKIPESPPVEKQQKQKRNLKNSAKNFAVGAEKVGRVAGRVAYTGAKIAGKTAIRTAAGIGLGAVGLAVGAITGDASKAATLAGAGFSAGYSAGGKIIDATVGKAWGIVERNRGIDGSIRSTYNKARYGGNIQAANVKADKEFQYSAEFGNHLDYYYSDKTQAERKQIAQAYMDYRKVGITSMEDTRKALKLEEKGYTREEAQNIVQLHNKNQISPKAWTDDKVYAKERRNIEEMLTNVDDPKRRRATAEKIMRAERAYRNL